MTSLGIDTALDGLMRTIIMMTMFFNNRSTEQLVETDLTPLQYFTMFIITEHDTVKMSELCNEIFLSQSTMTGVIDRLEKKGLVKRIRNGEDRRVIHVGLTSQGEEKFRQVYDEHLKLIKKALIQYDDEDKIRLIESLKLIRSSLMKIIEEG